MPKDISTTGLPEQGTTEAVTLEAGQVNTLAFSSDALVGQPTLGANGELQMVLDNGSTVIIDNFEELVYSTASCGRDTIIQFSDNAIIYPEEMYAQLSANTVMASAEDFAAIAPAAGIEDALGTMVLKVPEGTDTEITMKPGNDYKLGFDLSEISSMQQSGDDLIVSFNNGQTMTLKEYYAACDVPPALTLADGTVVTPDMLFQSLAEAQQTAEDVLLIEPAAGDEVPQPEETLLVEVEETEAMEIPNVEPAAGDELAAVAQELADIEPAAGDAGGVSAGRGYGFQSSVTPVDLLADPAVGPIDPTALQYQQPDIETFPALDLDDDDAPEIDSNPLLSVARNAVDETNGDNAASNSTDVSGTVTVDYGTDGPGTVTANGAFASSGSQTGGTLTSNGDAVSVTLTGNTYTGTAAGRDVFTLVVNADGTYTFTLLDQLDHADGTDDNDIITLNFGYTATDTDGDSDVSDIIIDVLDDIPVARDDAASIPQGSNSTSGNVLINDDAGFDDGAQVINVRFNGTDYPVSQTGTTTINGQFGQLEINSNGFYTYTSYNTATGTDNFTYTMRDFDTDTDTAELDLTVADIDTDPVATLARNSLDETNADNGGVSGSTDVSGTVTVDYGADGPGTVSANGNFSSGGSQTGGTLTSNGDAVNVTLAGNTYTGTAAGRDVFTLVVNADGTYTFTLLDQLDHADGTADNDIVTLNFGYTATDTDGDTATSDIVIDVLDDIPVARDDAASISQGSNSTSGNVLANDDDGYDDGSFVTNVNYNGTDYAVTPGSTTTINAQYGQLEINADGSYTYTSFNTATGTDNFTYTMRDFDTDTDTAQLNLTVGDLDTDPIATQEVNLVDETSGRSTGQVSVSDSVDVDYGADGPGTVSANGNFSSGGSQTGGTLTSNGDAVNVTLTGNTYTGAAAGRDVFTLVLNADGTYTFTLLDQLDHADGNNPNDIINLNFGYTATDTDGDTDTSDIVIRVRDDVPIARDDAASIPNGSNSTSGNVLTNDSDNFDDGPQVINVRFDGTDYAVNEGSATTINGQYGQLEINADGSYTYTSYNTATGTDQFTYTMRDFDTDTDTAQLNLTVGDIDTDPVADPEVINVDETNLDNGTIVYRDQLDADFKADTPGTYEFNGDFAAKCSLKNGQFSSEGSPIAVTTTASTITGTSADGRTIFTVNLNQSTGEYEFRLFDNVDHADGTDPNDILCFDIGFDVIDSDGDRASNVINVNIADDAPIAYDDTCIAEYGFRSTGNVLINDDLSQDVENTVVNINFQGTDYAVSEGSITTIMGQYGVFRIISNGDYDYTPYAANGSGGQEQFTYTLQDGDMDTDPAVLTVNLGADNVPIITQETNMVDETSGRASGEVSVSDSVDVDYGTDGPGSVSANGTFTSGGSQTGGTLTSMGQAVSVALNGNTYTGTAGGREVFTLTLNSNGTYNFTLKDQLDHADGNNPNDIINLNFGYTATDSDGDTATSNIRIDVKDDVPIARDDAASIPNGANSTSGNVLTNDSDNFDDGAVVTKVSFNGTEYNVPSSGVVTVNGDHGVLQLRGNGNYTYTSNNSTTGTDQFTYTMRDYDTDTDTAQLNLTVGDIDSVPTADKEVITVDETNLDNGTIVYRDQLDADFKVDNPGTYEFNGDFMAKCSLKNGQFSSEGSPIAVTTTASTITGTSADGRTIFTVNLNQSNGEYEFRLFDNVDHADGTDPNDILCFDIGFDVIDSDGDRASNVINVNIADDAPIAYDDNCIGEYGFRTLGNVIDNDDLSQDVVNTVTKIQFQGTSYNVSPGSITTITGQFGTLRIMSNGDFEYVPYRNASGTDQFTYTLTDGDMDSDTAILTVDVNADSQPIITQETNMVDETSGRASGEVSVSDSVDVDYGTDGPGSVSANGTFTSGGSQTGGTLTSMGQAVSVALNGNTYTGTAGGREVFTLTLNSNGTYNFTLKDQLDHADGNNPNDIINLNFGYTATDSDGDTATSNIRIDVKDDVPLARDDAASIPNGANSTSGNVLTNDSDNFDDGAVVTKVSFNGTEYNVPSSGVVTVNGDHGVLQLRGNGNYTYTSNNSTTGTDQFTYTMRDFDTDTDTAKLKLTVSDVDTDPVATQERNMVDETNMRSVSDTVDVDYGADGPGTVAAEGANTFSASGSMTNGALTSKGQAVSIALNGNTYTGTAGGREVFTLQINSDGTYSFRLKDQLDHADGTADNDIITLNFGYSATDTDGDVAYSDIIIDVKDDIPTARNDAASIPNGANSTSGNVLDNDSTGYDEGATVTKISFNGNTYDVPSSGQATVNGQYGVLKIAANGSYTYTSYNSATGTDQFTYTMRDYDTDTDTAQLNLTVGDIDTDPIATHECVEIDETSGRQTGQVEINDSVYVDFGADTPGAISANGTFTSGGSQTGGTLTSMGQAVSVALNGNTYTGTAGGREVFTLTLNSNGTYNFTLKDQLDHADGNNPNDIISLNFGYTATDSDGDTATNKITVDVKDDVPVARNDVATIPNGATSTSGNVLTNDSDNFDDGAVVTKVSFNGTEYNVPSSGVVTVNGDHGVLQLRGNGNYTYTSNNSTTGTDQFTYTMRDYDTDTDTAQLNLTVGDIDSVPTLDKEVINLDETNLDNGVITFNGNFDGDFKSDGPGSYQFDGSFTAACSLKNGQFTSEGSPISVNVTSNTITGTAADGRTIFTVTLNQSTGAYQFKLFDSVDHADGTDPNDILCFDIGVKATDGDGDVASNSFKVNIADDAVNAYNDTCPAYAGYRSRGNVMANDNLSQDAVNKVVNISSSMGNATVTTAGVMIMGLYGSLTIGQDGSYAYVPNTYASGQDVFTYTLQDGDMDTDTATLTFSVNYGSPNSTNVNTNTNVNNNSAEAEANSDASASASSRSSSVNSDDDGLSSSNVSSGSSSSENDSPSSASNELVHGAVTHEGTENGDVIFGTEGSDVINGKGGNDILYGQGGDDTLYGGAGDDVIYGGAGDDTIFVGGGDNIVHGGEGDDIIVSGQGRPGEDFGSDGSSQLWGDGGADIFLFQNNGGAGTDQIMDFNSGEGDMLDLSDFLHNYDPLTGAIENFVFQREMDGNTVISVDVTGSGNAQNAVDLVVLENVTGKHLDELVANIQAQQV